MHQANGLHLLIASIGAWNTVYLGQALTALVVEGQAVPAECLPHIAPLGWEHIKGLGHYSFAPATSGAGAGAALAECSRQRQHGGRAIRAGAAAGAPARSETSGHCADPDGPF